MGCPSGRMTRGNRAGVGFDPSRHVVHVAVFPGAEPQQDDMQVVIACAIHDGVNVGEVEFAGLWLELFPINGSLDGVGVQRSHRLPNLRQFAGPGAGVVNLTTENEERLAVNQQSVATILLHEPRRFGSERVGERSRKENDEKRDSAEKRRRSQGADTHVDHLLPQCNRVQLQIQLLSRRSDGSLSFAETDRFAGRRSGGLANDQSGG